MDIHVAAGNWPVDTLSFLSYAGDGMPTPRYTYHREPDALLGVDPAGETVLIVESSFKGMEALGHLTEIWGADVDTIAGPGRTVGYALWIGGRR